MAAGRRRKAGAVRQIGGRIAPEHRNGVMSQVVASRFPCPVCGSGKLRVTTSGQECEVCRQTREQRRRRRTVLRRTAVGRPVSWLVKERSREAGLMLSRYAVWQALGPDPLPQGRKTLDRLRVHLDAVYVLDTELKRRYVAGALASPVGITERQADAFRRRLFADLAAGRRGVDELLQPNDRLGDQQALLDGTHAFAVFSAQYGHRTAAAAFESVRVPVSLSWQAAADHLPTLVQATARTVATPSASPDHLEEITGLDREAEAAAARPRG
ncbi:hypothetical protein [Streptomyces sp. IB201691-2A2]|uniref:hypothetical protein n=1 Tax=Streptomyces sp. IB201691-2A2 TaxID=2561920 RepID=UPI001180808A|nr:hypothetical protein [Streptomyces sp. IB201691-2A2]TRO55780.1 hypothetical protein E4K73_49250 [Streptomyces sp. IB201691-2A2]